MQQNAMFEFTCPHCKQMVEFSTSLLNEQRPLVTCKTCKKIYSFEDETLMRQLKQFEALCRQIRASEEILGQASVGVNLGEKQVKIPFKLLLTRLTSHLDLMIGDQPLMITLRVEPLQEHGSKTISIK